MSVSRNACAPRTTTPMQFLVTLNLRGGIDRQVIVLHADFVGRILVTQVATVRSHFDAYLGATKPVSRRKKCQAGVVPKRVVRSDKRLTLPKDALEIQRVTERNFDPPPTDIARDCLLFTFLLAIIAGWHRQTSKVQSPKQCS